jgi:predicted MFS family arabinose efflux permease
VNRQLNLLALIVFASSLFMRAVDPIIPQIAIGLSVEPATAALLSTAFALPFAIIQPMVGALADMLNKTRLMIASLAVVATATLLCAFGSNFQFVIGARAVAGIAAGGLIPIAFAFVGDLVPVAGRQVAMGRLLFAIMSGNLLGASCAGVIGDFLGWRAVFVVMAGIGYVSLVVAALGFRSERKAMGHFDLSQVGPNYRAIFSNPFAKFCFGGVFLEAVFMYGLFPHVASLMHAAGETRASIAGIVLAGFGIGGVIYSLRVSWLLNHLGERWMMRLGGVLMGSCTAFVALGAPWPVDFVDFAVLGLAFYMLHAVIQIYASELAPQARGSAMALHSFFFFLGHAVGPALYGAAFATIGVTPILMIAGVVLVATGLTCAQFLRRSPAS